MSYIYSLVCLAQCLTLSPSGNICCLTKTNSKFMNIKLFPSILSLTTPNQKSYLSFLILSKILSSQKALLPCGLVVQLFCLCHVFSININSLSIAHVSLAITHSGSLIITFLHMLIEHLVCLLFFVRYQVRAIKVKYNMQLPLKGIAVQSQQFVYNGV